MLSCWRSAFQPSPSLSLLSPLRRSIRRAAESVYHNPILFADYSDPDVIRDGANYYLVASTFHFVPGIPILQSTDLVHWTIVGHVVQRMDMDPRYSMVGGNRYGKGVWAPSIRKHDGLYYVYFPTPTEGIFVSTAAKSPVRGAIPPPSSRSPASKTLPLLGRRRQGLPDPLHHRRRPAHPAPHVGGRQARAR